MLPYGFTVLLCSPANTFSLYLRCIVNEECLELKGFREQKVANVIAADGNVIESNGLSAFHSQLNCLQVSIHGDVHTYNILNYK
jgi:hypothetical protein